MENIALTSIDNPFNPFSEWNRWLSFDLTKGKQSCCCLLGSVAAMSSNFDDEAEDMQIEAAIDEIVANHPLNGYLKVRETPSHGMEILTVGPVYAD